MSRKIEDVQKDYANAAYELGQIHFQISEGSKQLEKLDVEARKRADKMEHLNREALKLQKEAELAKLAEEKKDESTTEAQ